MKSVTRVTIHHESGEKFFGEGPCRLLRAVEAHGSLRAAAISMEMAYSKAVKIIRNAEETLGYPLTRRAIGGRDGGGSSLTAEARAFLAKYEAWRDSCTSANQGMFDRIFQAKEPGGIACVIMASGMGRRFGGNKLMADFGGRPMIERILDASEGLFANRIVVTRHDDVQALCRGHGIPVIRHDLPHRNDAIRLALAAVGPGASGCIFCPSDQPLLRRESLQRFTEAAASDPSVILRLGFEDTVGSPVLFPAWCFAELTQLPEGAGGRLMLEKYRDQVQIIPAESALELRDVDTEEDLNSLTEET